MYIALIGDNTYVLADSIAGVMREAIREGYYSEEEEFVNQISTLDIYLLPDKPLTVSGKMQSPVFTVE